MDEREDAGNHSTRRAKTAFPRRAWERETGAWERESVGTRDNVPFSSAFWTNERMREITRRSAPKLHSHAERGNERTRDIKKHHLSLVQSQACHAAFVDLDGLRAGSDTGFLADRV